MLYRFFSEHFGIKNIYVALFEQLRYVKYGDAYSHA